MINFFKRQLVKNYTYNIDHNYVSRLPDKEKSEFATKIYNKITSDLDNEEVFKTVVEKVAELIAWDVKYKMEEDGTLDTIISKLKDDLLSRDGIKAKIDGVYGEQIKKFLTNNSSSHW